MADAALSALHRVAPWRQAVGWKIVLAEGAVALAIGVIILLQPDAARATFRQILGVALLLSSGLGAGAAFLAFYSVGVRMQEHRFRLFGGGIGMTVGLLVILEPFSASVGGEAGRSLLAVGLLVYGLFELAAGIAGFGSRGSGPGPWLNGALLRQFRAARPRQHLDGGRDRRSLRCAGPVRGTAADRIRPGAATRQAWANHEAQDRRVSREVALRRQPLNIR